MDLSALEREDLVEIINNQAAYIKELEGKLQLAEKNLPVKKVISKPSLPKDAVTVLGKKYLFRYPAFVFGGVNYRADEAQYDSALMEQIVGKPGQTILKLVD